MIAMLKEISIPIVDLRYLSVECKCGSKITIDLTKLAGIPEGCPSCQEYFDKQLATDIAGYSRALKNSDSVSYRLSFRIPDPD